MEKYLKINLDALLSSKEETVLVNFNIEKKVYEQFKSICKDDFGQSNVSSVLRNIITQCCEQYGKNKKNRH